ncbi:MAG: polyprenyl synthetase family protein [Pseudomonadota bacterium]
MSPDQTEAFSIALESAAARVTAALDDALPRVTGSPTGRLAAAMRRGALAGGKRLRAFLVIEAAKLFEHENPIGANRAAAAIECLHAYSLVHDDLPCMDDDDLRRGMPTVHVEWDEATAVLAGDALQTLAFSTLLDRRTDPDPALRAELALCLAHASGFHGMVGGQALDIAAETAATPLSLAEIDVLQAKKTGALITCAAELGAILGRADQAQRGALISYARDLGSAFQIADDVLDVTGDTKAAGKKLGKDSEAGKATFVTLLGLEGAQARAAELADSAASRLAPFGDAANALKLAAMFTISRRA